MASLLLSSSDAAVDVRDDDEHQTLNITGPIFLIGLVKENDIMPTRISLTNWGDLVRFFDKIWRRDPYVSRTPTLRDLKEGLIPFVQETTGVLQSTEEVVLLIIAQLVQIKFIRLDVSKYSGLVRDITVLHGSAFQFLNRLM